MKIDHEKIERAMDIISADNKRNIDLIERTIARQSTTTPGQNYPIQGAIAELIHQASLASQPELLQSVARELGVPVENITITRD